MKIKMLKTVNGTVDGERMGPYHKDQEYDLDDSRARLFIGSAMAEEVLPPPQEEAAETQAESVDRPRRGRRAE